MGREINALITSKYEVMKILMMALNHVTSQLK